jgi:hypothetical protein
MFSAAAIAVIKIQNVLREVFVRFASGNGLGVRIADGIALISGSRADGREKGGWSTDFDTVGQPGLGRAHEIDKGFGVGFVFGAPRNAHGVHKEV